MVILSSVTVFSVVYSHRQADTQRCTVNWTHQRDEVGEGHLDVDLCDVPALLHGPDVLVVALHQVPEELVLQVHCGRCRRAEFQSYRVTMKEVNGFNEV